ncbi:MAG: hypothetical protein HY769_05965 [Candidatus Stahlbacteria bacterium]|nr:hypothetical protein [Candidatus Stahlbacteria bacterium]
MAKEKISLKDVDPLLLFGRLDTTRRLFAQKYQANIILRGNTVILYGESDRIFELKLKILEMIKKSNAKYIVPTIGETVDLGGGVLMKFLGPVNRRYHGTKSDENNSSIVVKITYGNISMLFTGDVELEAENDLVGWRGELKSTVLKIAHHGSRTSTTSPFLDRVAPEIAVISSGSGNPFGHPSDDTIKKLVDRNINIYRTDQNGTITLLTNGTSLKITTER